MKLKILDGVVQIREMHLRLIEDGIHQTMGLIKQDFQLYRVVILIIPANSFFLKLMVIGGVLQSFLKKMPIIEDFIITRAESEDLILLKRPVFLSAVSRTKTHYSCFT